MVEDKTIHYAYLGTVFFIHFAYVLVFFGVLYINPAYIADLSSAVQIGVSLFLIWRFHPFREWMNLKEPRLTHFDRIVIYSSATFLLVNVALTATFTKYFIDRVETGVPGVQNVLQGYFLGGGATGHTTPATTRFTQSLNNFPTMSS
jgi:hypothetical protein